jgi:hypothetical protein
MTPLEAAQAIIDARAKATQGEWRHGRDISHYDAPEILTDKYSAYIPVLEDADFTALAANHAATVAQAYKDAMQDNARLRAALVDARAALKTVTVHQEWIVDDLAAIDAALEDAR